MRVFNFHLERRFGHTHLVARDIFRTVEADYHHCVGPHVVNGLRYDEVQVWGGLPQGLYNGEFEEIKARAGR